jgi:hypothetical protein
MNNGAINKIKRHAKVEKTKIEREREKFKKND